MSETLLVDAPTTAVPPAETVLPDIGLDPFGESESHGVEPEIERAAVPTPGAEHVTEAVEGTAARDAVAAADQGVEVVLDDLYTWVGVVLVGDALLDVPDQVRCTDPGVAFPFESIHAGRNLRTRSDRVK